MANEQVRHILGISGGKDSTALAFLLHDKIPNLEYFFCDTHRELDETYEYLDRIESRLGIKIKRLSSEKTFDDWLDLHGGFLPSAQARWCTVKMKIKPLEDFVGNDTAYSYVGIRADEKRSGYLSTAKKIRPVYIYKESNFVSRRFGEVLYDQRKTIKDFQEMGISLPIREHGYNIDDVKKILEENLGYPKYYEWRSRSGCFFCFFQRKHEWIKLAEKHPKLFEEAKKYEKIDPSGPRFTWCESETLDELLERKDQIIAEYEKSLNRKMKEMPNRTLVDVLGALDDEDLQKPCMICTL
jgi:3'-phosphoadenosine 5'-phosphosulfate sulfotransferase (PAPS reductase)/FAD synthetase